MIQQKEPVPGCVPLRQSEGWPQMESRRGRKEPRGPQTLRRGPRAVNLGGALAAQWLGFGALTAAARGPFLAEGQHSGSGSSKKSITAPAKSA